MFDLARAFSHGYFWQNKFLSYLNNLSNTASLNNPQFMIVLKFKMVSTCKQKKSETECNEIF